MPNNRRGKSICASICLLVPMVNDIEKEKKNNNMFHITFCRPVSQDFLLILIFLKLVFTNARLNQYFNYKIFGGPP